MRFPACSPQLAALSTLVVCFAMLYTVSDAASTVNVRPIIGILTLPCDESSCVGNATEYIAASYVKWVQSAGARVAPISYRSSVLALQVMLSSVNGVLFTGGGADISDSSPYFKTVLAIVQFAMNANQQGTVFPIWGTCLGFEALNSAMGGGPSVLTGDFDSENLALSLELTNAAAAAPLFSPPASFGFPSDSGKFTLSTLGSQNVTFNNHVMGVAPSLYTSNPWLKGNFSLLSVNHDRNGKPFASLIQGTVYPFFGSQFHPEKNAFEWNTRELLPHSPAAVSASLYLVQVFVNTARLNNQQFPSPQSEAAALIYNTPVVYTNTDFLECYFWYN